MVRMFFLKTSKQVVSLALLLLLVSCSTQDLVIGAIRVVPNMVAGASFAAKLSQEAGMLDDHWQILAYHKAAAPSDVSEADRRRLENDLIKMANLLSEEIRRLETGNEKLRMARYHTSRAAFPGFTVIVTREDNPSATTRQDSELPAVEISLGLLHHNLNNASEQIWDRRRQTQRELRGKYSGKKLDEEVLVRAAVPGALEYKESLLFLLAHEAVHAWLDPPVPPNSDVADDRERETRADALGLVLVSNVSYIVDVRQKIEGVESSILNVQSGSPRSIQRPVLFARSGPEYLFEVNQSLYDTDSPLYRPLDERHTDAVNFMKKSVYGNIKTPKDSYVFYILNKLGTR